MNIHLLKRRRLLGYCGLGIGAAVVGIGLKKSAIFKVGEPNASQEPSINRLISSPTSENNDSSTQNKNITASVPDQSLPTFQGISQWLNSPPLDMSDLKGKVVLVQFWTFACINCQHTLPYITRWHKQYAAQGLKVIGVHTPEFPFEKDVNNVKKALKQHQITYPVPIDNDFKTWSAYQNQYWPHLFLADRQGIRRYDHIGEGAYQETEQMIRKLLG